MYSRSTKARCRSLRIKPPLVSLLAWLAFGAVAVAPAVSGLTWQVAGYAVLSLTLVRMAPVAVALAGTRLGWPTVAFVGWFGPRGLASVVGGARSGARRRTRAAGPQAVPLTRLCGLILNVSGDEQIVA
jgi:hypothetical protein